MEAKLFNVIEEAYYPTLKPKIIVVDLLVDSN